MPDPAPSASVFSDPVLNAMIILVILSMIIERALAIVFDMEKLQPAIKKFDLKPIVAIVVSVLVCGVMGFNLPQVLVSTCGAECTPDGFKDGAWKGLGIVLTGFVVAGGSAGAVKLFQDILGFRRSTRDAAKQLADSEREAAKAEAEARLAKAEAEKKMAETQKLMATEVGATVSGAERTALNLVSNALVGKKIEDGYYRALSKVMRSA